MCRIFVCYSLGISVFAGAFLGLFVLTFSIGIVDSVEKTNKTQPYSFVDADLGRNDYLIIQVDLNDSRNA